MKTFFSANIIVSENFDLCDANNYKEYGTTREAISNLT